jgi:hypothetical protein
MTEYYVGIDNSHSGAIAMIDRDANVVFTMLMPVVNNEANYERIIDMIHGHDGGQHNTRVMLEEPHRFAKGINAVRIMWSCFQRIKVGLECSSMLPDCILPNQWQNKMLEVYGDKNSKGWAEKRVVEIWGDRFTKEYKSKKTREGINDALLIAEFCRRSYLGLDMPAKACK